MQRIENGETVPRGDTLNRLAKALEAGINELTSLQPASTNNSGYLALMNLSALTFLVIIRLPILGFVVPLILWLYKRDEFQDVREHGKKILNFQITWSIIGALYVLFLFVSMLHGVSSVMPSGLGMGGLGLPEMLLIGMVIPIAFNILMVIYNTILILTNKEMKFWLTYPFLKEDKQDISL